MSTKKYTCEICSKECATSQHLNGHKRSHKKIIQYTTYCCSLLTRKKVRAGALDVHERAYLKNLKQCKNCSASFSHINNIFCSQSCSTLYNNNLRPAKLETEKTKVSETLLDKFKNDLEFKEVHRKAAEKRKKLPHTKLYGYINCNCCTKGFWKRSTDNVCCSPECARKNSTYRKIIHEYKHKNGDIIFLESSWEVSIAKFLDENNIDWIRPKHIKYIDGKGKNRKYFPDFYIPSLNYYLDPKNEYQIKIGKEKLDIVGKEINLIYGTVESIVEFIQKNSYRSHNQLFDLGF